jgi:uncharacterized protein (TIGR03085 family)
MTNWAQQERRALADLMEAVGPEAPTLCEGWATRDLAAHLVVRERRPDAAAGLVLKPLAGHCEHVRAALTAAPWPDLLDQVRSGPPWWSPSAIDAIDRFVNTVEFAVHHEDVRRAGDAWEPRILDTDFEALLWHRLRQGARLMAWRSPAPLVLRTPGGDEVTAKKGDDPVVVTGAPLELTLFLFGRQAHARVDVSGGADDAAERVKTARLGL